MVMILCAMNSDFDHIVIRLWLVNKSHCYHHLPPSSLSSGNIPKDINEAFVHPR